jgi:hypothetical protein
MLNTIKSMSPTTPALKALPSDSVNDITYTNLELLALENRVINRISSIFTAYKEDPQIDYMQRILKLMIRLTKTLGITTTNKTVRQTDIDNICKLLDRSYDSKNVPAVPIHFLTLISCARTNILTANLFSQIYIELLKLLYTPVTEQ